jgi:uncharacterized protein YndB with AHSA1/START domain
MTKQKTKRLPLGRGKIGFKVYNTYPAPLSKVWDAITKAKHTQKFFVDKVTGDFGPELQPVQWYWKKWGNCTQWPIACQKEKKLEFVWENH